MAGSSTTESHESHKPPVGFLELFFDLVFVASTMVLSNEFSQNPSWGLAGQCSLMFALLWLLWFHMTVLMNVERQDDLGQRGIVFALMFVIFVTTLIFVRRDSSADLVGLGYLLAVLIVAFAHQRATKMPDPIGTWARSRRNRLLAAGVVMSFGVLIPDGPDAFLYGLAFLLLVVPTSLSGQAGRPVPAIDAHHLSERAALLTLIVLGESLVKAALVISSGSIVFFDGVALVVMFVILFGLYSTYFDDVPEAGIQPGALAGELWLLAHLILQLSIVALAVGISKFLQVGDAGIPSKAVVILMVAYVGIFAGLAFISLNDRRVPSSTTVGVHVGTAVLAGVAGWLTLQINWLVPSFYLLFLAGLTVANALLSWRVRLTTTVPHESDETSPALIQPTSPTNALEGSS
jgi:low temperature requirement protein LtrA